jgi:hypothetical protein
VLVYRGTRADLDALLKAVPLILAGKLPDPLGITRAVAFRMANALLSQVQQDFITLSRGGVSRDGRKWAPLKPSTVRKRTYKAIRAMRRDLRRRRGKPKPQLPPAALKFDIGRDTARMLRSLAVAVGEEFANPDTAVESIGGTLSVGTNVPYARWFHEGRPGVQEPRPLVPADGTIPDAWWPAIMAAAIRGIMAAIEYMVRVGYKP